MFCDYHGGKFIDEYKDYDKAQIVPPLPLEEQIAKIIAAFNLLEQMAQDILIPAVENICSILQPLLEKVSDCILNGYPNKRVVYLALHHGKHRVRKKNINRIAKWIEREGKNETATDKAHKA